MGFPEWIKNNWTLYRWVGSKNAPYGEKTQPTQTHPIETESGKSVSITTTVDCYITGSYTPIDSKKRKPIIKTFTIRHRFSVEVTYSLSTMKEAMARIREQIFQDFQRENPSFMIDSVIVPPLPPPRTPDPELLYRGGRLYRYLTRKQEGSFLLKTEKEIYKSRAEKIIERYGIKRKQAEIRKV